MRRLACRRLLLLLLSAVLLGLPASAGAQGANDDLAYCRALSDMYLQYLGHDIESSGRNRGTGNLDAQVAVAQCRQGNAAPSIPVLEGILRRNGFSLPKRS